VINKRGQYPTGHCRLNRGINRLIIRIANLIEKDLLLNVGKDPHQPGATIVTGTTGPLVGRNRPPGCWVLSVVRIPTSAATMGKLLVHIMETMQRQAELTHFIRALNAASGFTSCLDGRQQEGYQDANDGDHDEQLNEGETASRAAEIASALAN
jgi:hypothetical protein